MIKIEVNTKEVNNNLDKLKNADNLSGEHPVSLLDLFNTDFMKQHTEYKTIEALFEASGFKLNTEEDLEILSSDEWENFIVSHTDFSSWEEMQQEAAAEYTKAILLKGFNF